MTVYYRTHTVWHDAGDMLKAWHREDGALVITLDLDAVRDARKDQAFAVRSQWRVNGKEFEAIGVTVDPGARVMRVTAKASEWLYMWGQDGDE